MELEAMEVEMLCITKHGTMWINRNVDKIKREVACPECSTTHTEAFEKRFEEGIRVIRVYSPMELKEEAWTDIEFSCVNCGCEWIVQVKEKK